MPPRGGRDPSTGRVQGPSDFHADGSAPDALRPECGSGGAGRSETGSNHGKIGCQHRFQRLFRVRIASEGPSRLEMSHGLRHGWHVSRTVTTAFCCAKILTCQESPTPPPQSTGCAPPPA